MNYPRKLKIRSNYNLKDKTTFKVGGLAQYFCEPKDLKELKLTLLWASQNKLRVFILGSGSNILINDNGLKGLVIKLSSPCFKKISFRKNYIYSGSGVMVNEIVKFAQKRSLTGLEFLIGIPGTVGGALVMNAGCWGKDIGKLVKEAKVMDYSGEIKILKNKELRLKYRNSNLKDLVVLSVILKLKKGDSSQINKDSILYLRNKCLTQDLTSPSAGCIFKNPKGNFAGRLIDQCGLKGKRINDAIVSSKHANFILNKGRAKASDILRLIKFIQTRVKKKFGKNLIPEIKIWA